MKRYTITRTEGMPDWAAVPALDINTQMWSEAVDISGRARIAWSDDGLYVRMEAHEQDIRAQEQPPVGMPCMDSCLEFFFCPAADDPRYLNIEFSPTGCMFLGFGEGRADRIRLLPQAISLDPVIAYTANGWQVTYHVPMTLMRVFFPGLVLHTGSVIRANCYKCGDMTPVPHYLLWNPSTSAHADFHRSCDFGEMLLG